MTPTSRRLLPTILTATLLFAACGSETDTTADTTADTAADTAADITTADIDTAADTTATTDTVPAGRPMGGGTGGAAAPTPTEADIAYADVSASQVLDLWLPEGATGPVPLIIWIHGGAFKGGSKDMIGAEAQPMLDAGFAVASVEYRLSGEAIFPAGAQDVKAAVRWLRANADTYGLDPERFAAWGGSAGGHLAALLGTSGNLTTLLDDASLGNADVSSAVQAVVDWFGPIDFGQMDAQAALGEGGCTSPQAHDPADSPESIWVGGALQDTLDVVAQANPITYIAANPDLPAFSIAHGDADCNIPFQQSQLLAQALVDAGEQPELTILPGATHGDAQFDETLLAPTLEWLATVLA